MTLPHGWVGARTRPPLDLRPRTAEIVPMQAYDVGGAAKGSRERLRSLVPLLLVVLSATAGCIAVVWVAFADLTGNTRSRQLAAAACSLPLWIVAVLVVWRGARVSLIAGAVGTVLCIVGALLVASEASLSGDGLGVLDFVALPCVAIAGTLVARGIAKPSRAVAQSDAENPPSPEPAWFADPRGRFDMRYRDGHQWTPDVLSGGSIAKDPDGV